MKTINPQVGQGTGGGGGAADTSRTAPRRCLQLRTKMDYVTLETGRPSGIPEELDDDATYGGTAHKHYCLRTMTVIGPDDDVVGPRVCVAGRACYESSGF